MRKFITLLHCIGPFCSFPPPGTPHPVGMGFDLRQVRCRTKPHKIWGVGVQRRCPTSTAAQCFSMWEPHIPRELLVESAASSCSCGRTIASVFVWFIGIKEDYR